MNKPLSNDPATFHKRLSWDAKVDAYNRAIDLLRGEECAYDEEGDYRAARYWLADKLDKECDRWVKSVKPPPKEEPKCPE